MSARNANSTRAAMAMVTGSMRSKLAGSSSAPSTVWATRSSAVARLTSASRASSPGEVCSPGDATTDSTSGWLNASRTRSLATSALLASTAKPLSSATRVSTRNAASSDNAWILATSSSPGMLAPSRRFDGPIVAHRGPGRNEGRALTSPNTVEREVRVGAARRHVIGVDLGGTNARAGIADGTGTLLAWRTEPTSFGDLASVLGQLVGLAKETAKDAGVAMTAVDSVAIAVPGACHPATQ